MLVLCLTDRCSRLRIGEAIGLTVLCMNNEVDLEHWPERVSEKELGGWVTQNYLQTMSSD